MKPLFDLVFGLALLLAAAWVFLPIFFSLFVMFLPFIGTALIILVIVGVIAR